MSFIIMPYRFTAYRETEYFPDFISERRREGSMRFSQKAVALAIAVMTGVLVAGCGKTAEPEKAQLVKTETVGAQTGAAAFEYTGTVKGRYESKLAFQVGGRITARNVQLGSIVHAGDVLMTVNPQDVEQGVTKAQAAVTAAASQLSLAETNLARYQALYAQDAVSAAVLDQYRNAYDQAAAQYNQASAAAAVQENQLAYTQLTADADGVIAAVSGEPGQVVSPGQTVLTLVKGDALEVEFNVPENRIKDFEVGKDVAVSFWALKGVSVTAKVREIAPLADAATRTYKVTASLLQPPQGLQLGMTATVKEVNEIGDGTTCLLPLSAIYQTGDVPQVWVVGKDRKLFLQTVTVEAFDEDRVLVRGLQKGDTVVTAGVHVLSQGQTVRTEGDE